jgi:ankyrin repeat protein
MVTRFLQLVGAGAIAEVITLLDQTPSLVNAVGPHPFWGGRPQALHLAVEGNRADLFALLLERGADVSGSNDDYDHWSPLMLSLNRGRAAMTEELLRRGARVGLPEALLLADDAVVNRLLGDGPLPSITPNGGSLLAFARTPWAIDRLLALGASADTKDRWGATPIDAFSRLGRSGDALVTHLVERGCTARPQDYARLGDWARLRTLVERDPAVARSEAVMMAAVDSGHHAIVGWLLEHGAPVDARTDAGSRHTALHSAAWNGDREMVAQLLAGGADATLRDGEHDATAAEWAEVAVRVTNNPRCAEVAVLLRERE